MNPWIAVSNNEIMIHELCTSIRHNNIGVLYGCRGSGTTTVMKAAIQRLEIAEHHRPLRCVYAALWDPAYKTSHVLATPAGFMTMLEIIVGLRSISKLYDSALSYQHNQWYQKPTSTYTPRQFASMYSFVRDECRRLRIDAVLIDNADKLDRFAFERLLDIRTFFGEAFALMLCFKRAFAGAPNEHAEALFHATLHDVHDYDVFNLDPLSEYDVKHTVFVEWIKQYNLQITASDAELLLMRRMLWNETHGDWRRIQKYAHRLQEYCQQARHPHLSQIVWEAIFQKPLTASETAHPQPSKNRAKKQTTPSQ